MLFKPDWIFCLFLDYLSVPKRKQMCYIQEKLMTEFRTYEEDNYPDDTDRLTKLILRLPPLRGLQAGVMEELFFAGLIGQVEIHQVIPYILRMDTYQGITGEGKWYKKTIPRNFPQVSQFLNTNWRCLDENRANFVRGAYSYHYSRKKFSYFQ